MVDVRGFDFGKSVQQLLREKAIEKSNLQTAALNRDIATQGLQTRQLEQEQAANAIGLREAALGARQQAEGEPISQEQAMLRLIAQDPSQADKITESIGLRTDAQKKQFANFAFDMLATPYAEREAKINARAQQIRARGGDPTQTLQLLSLDEDTQNKALEAGKIAALSVKERIDLERGIGRPSGQREFEALTKGFTPEEQEQARRIKAGIAPRAVGSAAQTIATTGTAADVGASEAVITKSKEAAKLEARLDLEPAVAEAVARSKAQAIESVKAVGAVRSNDVAYNTYRTAMANLAESLGDTATGPIVGWLPAITDNQQIAKGAVAMMAPVLKTLFRGAGEGTFTDKDQELLMDMVPTRTDSPAAIKAKINGINSIVLSKLAIDEAAAQTGGNNAPTQKQTVGRFTIEVEQ